MLTSRQPRGLTLIEVMVTISIFALLMAVAAPSLGIWVQNSRVRASAESVLNGLQRARSEAVTRNARVRFQLTSTADNGCVLSTNGTNWVVNVDQTNDAGLVEGQCGNAPDDSQSPWILEVRPAADGSTGVLVNGSNSSVEFNGLGQIVPAGAGLTVDVTYSGGANCTSDGGTINCLRVVVTPGGQIRMCSPGITAINPSDPQAC